MSHRGGQQLALFADPPQPRPRRYEPRRFYRMVLQLRSLGYRVYRRGRQHLVAGRQMTTRELVRFFRSIPLVAGAVAT